MTQLQPHKDLYAIPVPLDACNYEFSYFNYQKQDYTNELTIIFDTEMWKHKYKINDRPHRLLRVGGNWQILGEVTKDSIPYGVLKLAFKDGEFGHGIKILEERIYSLLAVNGVHFVNPMPKPADDDYSFYTHINLSAKEEWQSFEDKLVEKVLIIQNVEK